MKITLDLGTSKTGTTSRQDYIYPRLPNSIYIGKLTDWKKYPKGPSLLTGSVSLSDNERKWDALSNAEIPVMIGALLAHLVEHYRATVNTRNDRYSAVLNSIGVGLSTLSDRYPSDSIHGIYCEEKLLTNILHSIPETANPEDYSAPLNIVAPLFNKYDTTAIVFLREPFKYLCSRYIQIMKLRREKSLALLTPIQFLEAHKRIYKVKKESSVLWTAYQKNFLECLQEMCTFEIKCIQYESFGPITTFSLIRFLNTEITGDTSDSTSGCEDPLHISNVTMDDEVKIRLVQEITGEAQYQRAISMLQKQIIDALSVLGIRREIEANMLN